MIRPFVRLTALAFATLSCAPTALAQEVWSVGNQRVSLEVGEAKFIRLEKGASAVFLSNPAAAEIDLQSNRYLYIVGKQIGETNLFALGENDEEVMSATITVKLDVEKLARAANRSIIGGNISISAEDGAVFISGQVRNADDAATVHDVVQGLVSDGTLVVNRMHLQELAQVNLQVRIAEVSRSISEDLGITLNASSSNGRRSIGAPNSDGGGFNINISSGSRNINLVLDALARNGLVSILSEPNLTARSGENATFLAGGRVPYETTNSDGNTSYTLEPIGVELDFTPIVRDSDQIEIKMTTRVRDIDPSSSPTSAAPSLTERSATTTVELGSGQSFAIAGMFKANSIQSLREMPGVAKIPVIGALFRSSSFAKGETELVIIVTPYLVRPGAANSMATPVDNLNMAKSGIEQAATGQMVRPFRPGVTEGTSRVKRGGFLLE